MQIILFSGSIYSTDVVTSTHTGANGGFAFPSVQNGDYTVKSKWNGVYTAVRSLRVQGSNPAPILLQPATAALPSTVHAGWNTSLGMINVAELSNNSASDLLVSYVIRDRLGSTLKTGQLNLAAQNRKFDLIVSDFVPVNAYGTVEFDVTGAAADLFRCDVANYRPAQSGSSREFDFAFSVPCQAPTVGESAVLTNRVFPGDVSFLRMVSNWLTLANLSNEDHSYTVRSYSETGELVGTDAVDLGGYERRDIDLAQYSNFTLASIESDDVRAPYLAVLNRYDNGLSNSRVLAFGSPAQDGDSETRCVPISNLINTSSYTEMGNFADGPTTVSAVLYTAAGSIADTGTISIPSYGVKHIEFAGQLPVGSAGSLCLSANVSRALIFNQATYYFSAQHELTTAFLTTPNRNIGVSSVFGAKNFFFNTFNWLRLLNLSDDASSVEVTSDPDEAGEVISNYLLAPHQRIDIALHDSPFSRVLDTYGRFRVNGVVAADLVRVIPNSGSTDGVTFATSVR
ncbi:MAG: hypothetical protein U0136_21315 [Bdellovibrionota bacterium]